jgi:hypothetical protein
MDRVCKTLYFALSDRIESAHAASAAATSLGNFRSLAPVTDTVTQYRPVGNL